MSGGAPGIWSVAPNMAVVSSDFGFARLPNGLVISAGSTGFGSVADAQKFDGVSWASIAPPPAAVKPGVAIAMPVTGAGDLLLVPTRIVSVPDLLSRRLDGTLLTWTTQTMTGVKVADYQNLIELDSGIILAALVGTSSMGPFISDKVAKFDPALGTWSVSATVTTVSSRGGHSTTKLADGRVFLAGGTDELGTFHTTSEVSTDNAVTAFVSKAGMVTPRLGHAAVLLQDGRVMVVGGEDSLGNAVLTAEIYDPIGDTWSPAGTTTSHFDTGHQAIVLSDGKVLVCGGFADGAGESLNTAEVWDSGSNAWAVAATMTTPRAVFGALLYETVPNDKVLIFGGENYDGMALDVEVD